MPNEPQASSASSKLVMLATPLVLLATTISTLPAAGAPSVKDRLARVRATIAAQADQPSDAPILTRSFGDGAPGPKK
ncbi:MAG TPA: hypothetical protein VMR25_24765 [Planctomycetaceae bacterium]|jgi:hypothetical protein|nr:hypothetical protein [Planctomycetaceae bacterium]